jgi:hypothetical protein
MIAGGFGPDVRTIDGASYALCLPVANGDVFESVLAFSPGS